LDKTLRIYAWFLLVVTALPAAARLGKPRELARIVMLRYQDPRRRKRTRITGFIYLGLALLGIPFLLHAQARQARWIIILLLLVILSAVESLFNSRVPNEEALARQNRLFGGVYAAIAIATALLLFTR
jgi:phosphoglycerol transferase MdoB-like AlkP superfamily enzyme